MTYASVVLTLLKIVSMIVEAINRQKQFDAGVDSEIARATQAILVKTQAGKAMMEKVNAMSDDEVDAGLRGLEPRGLSKP